MIQVRNKLSLKGITSSSSRSFLNDRLRTFTNNTSKPKVKCESVIGPCFKCNGVGHITRDCPTKLDRKSKLIHSNFSFFSREDDYELGDDEDVSYIEMENCVPYSLIKDK